MISVGHGLKDLRLFMMKKHATDIELGAVLMLQIRSLRDFLNVRKTMTEDQIGETAHMIMDEYDDFSFTAIMDCFNKIKRSRPPFHEKLYESLDGRKIMEYLSIYRAYQSEFLENAHKDRQQQSEFNISALAKYEKDETGELKPKNDKVIKGLQSLAHKLRVDAMNDREKEYYERSQMDEMVKGWILDFDKIRDADTTGELQKPGQLDLYLERRMREYNESKNQR